jgi:hypothetical protein
MYKAVHTSTCLLVRTGMYHFEVSRTALYQVRYVLACTSTYHLVRPCTRCTGFQIMTHWYLAGESSWDMNLPVIYSLPRARGWSQGYIRLPL